MTRAQFAWHVVVVPRCGSRTREILLIRWQRGCRPHGCLCLWRLRMTYRQFDVAVGVVRRIALLLWRRIENRWPQKDARTLNGGGLRDRGHQLRILGLNLAKDGFCVAAARYEGAKKCYEHSQLARERGLRSSDSWHSCRHSPQRGTQASRD